MKLIVGLGNIGTLYKGTYHNVGFLTVDKLVKKFDAKFCKRECKADVATFFVGDQKIVVAKPRTFMNLSGDSVREFVNKYKIDTKDVMIVYDDIDLPVGKIRFRKEGSAGTHNGMRDILFKLDTTQVERVRVGIGRPQNDKIDLKDFVLSKMDGDTKIEIDKASDQAVEVLEKFCREETNENS